jgi:hypothetical protein
MRCCSGRQKIVAVKVRFRAQAANSGYMLARGVQEWSCRGDVVGGFGHDVK